jgi:hypothetical protein
MRQLEGGGEERGGCRKKAEGVVIGKCRRQIVKFRNLLMERRKGQFEAIEERQNYR